MVHLVRIFYYEQIASFYLGTDYVPKPWQFSRIPDRACFCLINSRRLALVYFADFKVLAREACQGSLLMYVGIRGKCTKRAKT